MQHDIFDLIRVPLAHRKEVTSLCSAKQSPDILMQTGSELVLSGLEVLGNTVYDIDTKAVTAFAYPEIDDVLHCLHDGRIFPVQIRLTDGKSVQIILSSQRIILPCAPSERRLPVVRDLIKPVIVITVWVVFSLS